MTTNVEMAEFFSHFAHAVSTCDIDAICNTFARVFGHSDPESIQFISGPTHIRELVQQSVERYVNLGFNRIRISRLTPNCYDSDHAYADLEWILLDSDGQELARFDHSYMLRRMNGRWRIVFVIAHNETARLKAVGLSS